MIMIYWFDKRIPPGGTPLQSTSAIPVMPRGSGWLSSCQMNPTGCPRHPDTWTSMNKMNILSQNISTIHLQFCLNYSSSFLLHSPDINNIFKRGPLLTRGEFRDNIPMKVADLISVFDFSGGGGVGEAGVTHRSPKPESEGRGCWVFRCKTYDNPPWPEDVRIHSLHSAAASPHHHLRNGKLWVLRLFSRPAHNMSS